jgi:PKD domain
MADLMRRRPAVLTGLAALVVIAAVVAVVAVASGGDDKSSKAVTKSSLEDPNPDNTQFHMGADAHPFAGAAPLTIKFNTATFRPSGKVKYYWRFDDGTTSTQPSPTHTFKEPGYYTVLVTARDEKGHRDGYTLITGAWPADLWATTQNRRLTKQEQLKAVREQGRRTKKRRDRLTKQGKGSLIAPQS